MAGFLGSFSGVMRSPASRLVPLSILNYGADRLCGPAAGVPFNSALFSPLPTPASPAGRGFSYSADARRRAVKTLSHLSPSERRDRIDGLHIEIRPAHIFGRSAYRIRAPGLDIASGLAGKVSGNPSHAAPARGGAVALRQPLRYAAPDLRRATASRHLATALARSSCTRSASR